jgi:hypothetical protein
MRFLGGYVLPSECRWKGGRLSETEVTETQSVQSLACLPYRKNVPQKNNKNHCLKEEVRPRGAREELCLVSNLKPINALRRKPERMYTW